MSAIAASRSNGSRGGRIHGIAGWFRGDVRGASGSADPRGDHAVDRHLRGDVHPADAVSCGPSHAIGRRARAFRKAYRRTPETASAPLSQARCAWAALVHARDAPAPVEVERPGSGAIPRGRVLGASAKRLDGEHAGRSAASVRHVGEGTPSPARPVRVPGRPCHHMGRAVDRRRIGRLRVVSEGEKLDRVERGGDPAGGGPARGRVPRHTMRRVGGARPDRDGQSVVRASCRSRGPAGTSACAAAPMARRAIPHRVGEPELSGQCRARGALRR